MNISKFLHKVDVICNHGTDYFITTDALNSLIAS